MMTMKMLNNKRVPNYKNKAPQRNNQDNNKKSKTKSKNQKSKTHYQSYLHKKSNKITNRANNPKQQFSASNTLSTNKSPMAAAHEHQQSS